MPAPDRPALATLSPTQSILFLRFIWAGLILSQFAFIAVEFIFLAPRRNAPSPGTHPILFYINLALLALIIPAAHFLRRLILHRARTAAGGDGIPFLASAIGNIVFWAGCEFCSLFGLVVALINRNFWPSIVCVCAALIFQITAFPRPSHPDPH